ncbi:uncharacterized protein LOC127810403 isoform X2 [Diospyros lotus]|uniref:uncharacterized protein LOC127810403 isoform X2 n=1 Tax=Diospyros lotus TaxID=55363 RepID=UPI00225063BD|nr:uncharacterized protein LOC127810403 isoform X2 [Diospyros lotus]
MRKHSLLSHNSGTFTSPGTPEYRDGTMGAIQKGWSSERVPLPSNGNRRHMSAAVLMPFNSGRTLPSKWDDAERWITSPISGFGVTKTLLAQPQRRPKSKSGPLGAPGAGCFSNYSPAMPVLQGGSVRDFIVGSPFTTGVLKPDGLSIHYYGQHGSQPNPVHTENIMAQATSLPGWSDMLNEKLDGAKDADATVSRVVSRRDMATQMSPGDSIHSSPSTSPPPILPIVDLVNNHSPKMEIRDVQVDKSFTMTRHSKNHGVRKTNHSSPDLKHLASSWDTGEAAKNMSKQQREEARITAWENLQKARAEAAIRKLEMKLEKRRSASMDKILNKLRVAETKAQEMRNSMAERCEDPAPRSSHKIISFWNFLKMGSLKGCFIRHAS